jgi:class 3 adenylate cyclase
VVDAPRTQYARSDGLHVAYQVLGEGPPDLLLMAGVIPIDMCDEQPSLARFHRRLASFSRLVRMHFRGMGLSDPVPPASVPALKQHVHDALAVMDAVGTARGAVFATGWHVSDAISLAVSYPERVSQVIVVNGTARTAPAPDYPSGVSRELRNEYDNLIFEPDAVDRGYDLLALMNPSVAHDPVYRAWWDRGGNRGAGPAMARAISDLYMGTDVRHLLGSVQAPTLIVHRRGLNSAGIVPVEAGRYLAEHIPDARYVELEGIDQSYWLGDTGAMLDEIEEFLTGVRHDPEPDRTLVAVLFTDIVASTERIVEIGERGWRDLLDRHDAATRQQLERFGGREIKTTGDGMLATFDLPARAVQSGCAIRDAAAQLGVAVRVGVHFGEVELRGGDIAGMTVHIAARIHALADPGEVLVSRTVADLVAGSSIAFRDRGEYELKGVPATWQVFGVTDT